MSYFKAGIINFHRLPVGINRNAQHNWSGHRQSMLQLKNLQQLLLHEIIILKKGFSGPKQKN